MSPRIFLLIGLAPLTLAGQQAAPAGPALTATGAFIALSVPDLEASAAWYIEKLGLQVVLDPAANEGIRVQVLEGGGLMVELLEDTSAVALSAAAPSIGHVTKVLGIFKAGVLVTDYDRTVATLRQRGVEIAYGPYPARDGQRANLIIRDNAGNLLQLFGR
jgi:catechol 2,3-dioxygenase-like lactoylglutathione lyase family enzyme